MAKTEIKIGGFGGQGVILTGFIIGKAASLYDNKDATMTQAFGPEARGSACRAQVIVSEEAIHYPYVKRPQVMVIMSQEAFSKFSEAGALEVHLATNFQNMMYDRLPPELLQEVYAFLTKNHSDERKEGQTDEQFYYNARKRALGPFKKHFWQLPPATLKVIEAAWEQQFDLLFKRLAIGGTKAEVDRFVRTVAVKVPLSDYLRQAGVEEDVKDLAD